MREEPRTTLSSRTLMASADDAARGEPDGVVADAGEGGDDAVMRL